MIEPSFDYEHVQEHRAEFEERWRLEAIERGMTACQEFLDAEREDIHLAVLWLKEHCASAASSAEDELNPDELMKAAEVYMSLITKQQDALSEFTQGFQELRDARPEWRNSSRRYIHNKDDK